MIHYAKRDLIQLADHYIMHLVALSEEQLNSKSDIAAELAFRDQRIEQLTKALKQLRSELSSLQSSVQHKVK